MKLASLAITLVAFSACVPPRTYSLSTTQGVATMPKAAGCEFRIVNLPPSGDFEEVATISVVYVPAKNPDEFKQAIRDKVCKVGGDVVISEINGDGLYVRGTVLRAKASPDGSATMPDRS